MTDGSATTDHTDTRAGDRSELRVGAAPGAIRKGRFLALLLLVNWGVMGVYVLSQGVRSLVGGLAFFLGLFALIGGLSYLRASRNAATLPLIEIADGELRHRRFSSTEWSSIRLQEIVSIEDRARDALVVRTRDGRREDISWLAVSDPDRERVVEAVEHQAAIVDDEDGGVRADS